MIALSLALVSAAENAGIDIPDNPDDFDKNEYPYFHLFCCAQLGQPMPYMGCHWENAKIIAGLKKEEIKLLHLNS